MSQSAITSSAVLTESSASIDNQSQFSRILERVQPFLYLLPALLTIAVWIYRPLIGTFYLSFFEWNLLPTSPMKYVGWQNYQRILELPELRQAVVNTLIYIVGILPVSVILPLTIAVVTDRISNRWRGIYRALIFVPLVMAPVVVSVIWQWILHPTHGIYSFVVEDLLGGEAVSLFNSQRMAIWAIIFITGWKLVGFSTLIFSAGISNINRSYIEAASIDGATYWQIVRRIILPLLSSTTLLMVMLSVLLVSQWTFAYINVLTQGGPLGTTTNVYYILYMYGFRTFAIGWSSAAAVILFISFGILAGLLLRLSDRYAFYDS